MVQFFVQNLRTLALSASHIFRCAVSTRDDAGSEQAALNRGERIKRNNDPDAAGIVRLFSARVPMLAS